MDGYSVIEIDVLFHHVDDLNLPLTRLIFFSSKNGEKKSIELYFGVTY